MQSADHLQPTGTTTRIAARSRPTQDRSRARRNALLDAAEEIVAEVGIDGLRMREVSRRTGLPIASIYHYYPSTASMVRELSIRHLQTLASLLMDRVAARLPGDETASDRGRLVSLIIDDIAGYLFSRPSVASIWIGLHANPDLRRLDIEDTLRNAALLEPSVRRLVPGLSAANARAMAVVMLQAVAANLLLALERPADERARMVAALKAFVISAVDGLSTG